MTEKSEEMRNKKIIGSQKECVYGGDSDYNFEENGKCLKKNPCIHIDCCSYEEKKENQKRSEAE
jgi:hypothetical protein